jgi:hemoglobin
MTEQPAEPTLYDKLGGDAEVRALVDRFYDAMERLPEAATIRAMHPNNLAGSREKLYEFLSGWLGGPQLYIQRRGHPRLRARHLPFAIATPEAAAWMLCMAEAIDGLPAGVSAMTRETLWSQLGQVAGFMRNTPDAEPPT